MSVPPFEVSVQWMDGRPTITIRGEIDFATAPDLQKALKEVLDQGADYLTLDFREVTFLDSEGLKILLQAYRELHLRGGKLTVQGCSQFVAKTFEILGLQSYFEIQEEKGQNRC